MATSNGTGAAARLNSPQERPREGEAGQERAWLAGMAWLGGLTPAERDAALAAVAAPAQMHADGAPSRAETLLDIASEIRRWGSVGLYGAADRLEALAQEMAADAPAPAVDPLSFMPDAERLGLALDAAYQIEALMNALVDITAKMVAGDVTGSEDLALRSIAIRTRDLACTVMSSQEAAADIDELHRTVHGTYRAAAGAAS